MQMWIDSSAHDMTTGDVGYLVRTVDNNNRGSESYALRERPLRTNRSNEPRLEGWCGETDNRSRHAVGVWKVVQVNKAGDRARISRLVGEDLVVFLRGDGHPNLVPENLRDVAEAIEAGEEDGAEEATNVYNEQGAEVVRATLKPGHLGWDEQAAGARTHAMRGIPEDFAPAYYRAYERSARATAERLVAA